MLLHLLVATLLMVLQLGCVFNSTIQAPLQSATPETEVSRCYTCGIGTSDVAAVMCRNASLAFIVSDTCHDDLRNHFRQVLMTAYVCHIDENALLLPHDTSVHARAVAADQDHSVPLLHGICLAVLGASAAAEDRISPGSAAGETADCRTQNDMCKYPSAASLLSHLASSCK